MARIPDRKGLLLKLVLAWLILNLLSFKCLASVFEGAFAAPSSPPVPYFARMLFPLGLSYIIFRLIHYIVEVYRGNISGGSFPDLALYVLFFPTFLAGPIERFPNFCSQSRKEGVFDISAANYGLLRIAFGLIKKVIIADNLGNIIVPIVASPQSYGLSVVLLAIYGFAVQIYMDFSGYTDIAIGSARLFGYKIIENFNRPFFQNNIASFWRNWHISLYLFIRDYLFYPLFGYRASKAKTYIGLFITFLLFNLWHRLSLDFLISGIYFGTGLVIWYAFQDLKMKVPAVRNAVSGPYLRVFSVFLTFNFVAFGFSFFGFGAQKILSTIQRIL